MGIIMESFDLRHTIIPFSLLQIANHFQQMKAGEEMEIFGNDAGIARDLKNILPASEATIQAEETPAQERPGFRWCVKKKIPSPSDKKGETSCLKQI
jgi:TusA-related sulfurtransferase